MVWIKPQVKLGNFVAELSQGVLFRVVNKLTLTCFHPLSLALAVGSTKG